MKPFEVNKGLKRFRWTEANLHAAIAELQASEKPKLNTIAKKFGIPRNTLRRHFKKSNKEGSNGVRKLGRSTAFPIALENELARRLLQLEERMFGVHISTFRKAIFKLAVLLKVTHRFNPERELVGKKWYYAFMRRHKDELSLRRPQATSLARMYGFNRFSAGYFFNKLEQIVAKNDINRSRIYNMDESGYSVVQNRCLQVIGKKGKKRVGTVSSGERGTNNTVVLCVSPNEDFVPPMIILKGKRMVKFEDAPENSLLCMSDTGYINSELFLKWMEHFIQWTRPTIENKILLVLDGHSTHTQNFEALDLAEKNGVVVLSLPPHSTHHMQPLDVGVFKSLNSNYASAVENWMRENASQAVTQANICSLINQAYVKTKNSIKVANAFEKTGIWPVNRSKFTDADFAASDALLAADDVDVSDLTEFNNFDSTPEILDSEPNCEPEDLPTEPESVSTLSTEVETEDTMELTKFVDEVLPLPKIIIKRKKKSTRTQKSEELTDPEYLKKLAENKARIKIKRQESIAKHLMQVAKLEKQNLDESVALVQPMVDIPAQMLAEKTTKTGVRKKSTKTVKKEIPVQMLAEKTKKTGVRKKSTKTMKKTIPMAEICAGVCMDPPEHDSKLSTPAIVTKAQRVPVRTGKRVFDKNKVSMIKIEPQSPTPAKRSKIEKAPKAIKTKRMPLGTVPLNIICCDMKINMATDRVLRKRNV